MISMISTDDRLDTMLINTMIDFAGLSSGDHTRKLCAAILRVVLGDEYCENTKASCSQFGKTKLFLKAGQVEIHLFSEMLNCFHTKLRQPWGYMRDIKKKLSCCETVKNNLFQVNVKTCNVKLFSGLVSLELWWIGFLLAPFIHHLQNL